MSLFPLLPEANSAVLVLDQTRLPHSEAQLRLATLEEVAVAIETMQIRGAPLIGATAAFGLALAMNRDASDTGLAHAYARLARTRPTAVNLHWALDRMRNVLQGQAPSARKNAAWQEACAIREADIAANHAIGRYGAALIEAIAARRPGPIQVMTHCNAGILATCGWGTALAPVYVAHAASLPVEVWASETRPRNQGLLTAWELAHEGVPRRVLVDNAAAWLMQQRRVDLVIVGADRIAANGDTANKIGTWLKALAAKACGIPFYVAAPTSTVDLKCPEGGAIQIEERSADEVRDVWGLDETGALAHLRQTSADCVNPAFDVTPSELISGIITERGIFAPGAIGEAFA